MSNKPKERCIRSVSFNVIKSLQKAGPILDSSAPPEPGQAHPREADPGPRRGYQALCLGGLDCSLSCLMLGDGPVLASGVHPYPANSIPPQPRRETVCGRIWLPLSVDGLTPGPSPSTVFPPHSQPRNPTSHHSLPMGLIRRDRARPWEEGTAPARTEGEMRACKGILSGKLKLKEPFYTTAHL